MAESIFHRIVVYENAFTQLLCNLMNRDEKFRNQVVGLLLFGKVTKEAYGSVEIIPQRRLPGGHGQPDIRIESTDLCVIVEAKTNPLTSLTSTQKASSEEKSYMSYLHEQREKGKRAILTFLVPRSRKDGLPQGTSRVPVRIVWWEDILKLLEDRKKLVREGHPLLEEFRLLLSQHFGPITFDGEEIKLMFSQKYPIANFLKLFAVLEALRKKAKGERGKLSFDKDEAGFFLGSGASQLFVGCWASLWDTDFHYPICFGVKDANRDVREAFIAACKEQSMQQPVKFGEWWMSGVTKGDLDGLGADDRIWSKLRPIWNKVKDAAK